ncbi:SET domain-containing protein [Tundrisphaera sp. TA3]|uniref:SET domain-containing protein n=1 Tax=Tundrisphaera sp. TA3 TaxID=3435775 RepID=UPI003EBF6391
MGFEPPDAVEVKKAEGKGLGVFARRPIGKGELIERAPVLLMSDKEYCSGVDKTLLAGYVFAWGEGQIALVLGFGSIYNHSYKPNARYDDDADEPKAKEYIAIRDIAAGEEITINYNGSPTSRAKVWFDVVKEPPKISARRKAKSSG